MGSSGRKSSPENPVNFMKVILSDDTQSTGIRLPEKFTEKHGNKLLDRVILKVPNRDVWQVDLKRSNGEIWLKTGWEEFADHYSLNFGHLLMFKYEGFSIFGVIIFDASASEIVYPKNRDQNGNSTNGKARKGQDSCKKVNFTELKTVKSETSSSWNEDQETGRKINDGGECSSKRGQQRRMDDGRKALERAKANFKCDKPFFMVYMYKSYVTGKAGVHIPTKFRNKNWRDFKKHSKCLLQIRNDERQRTWEAVANNTSLATVDWMIFVKDNDVSVGDICAFELIQKHKNVLGVTILKSASNPPKSK